jgi:hypothetical protein
MGLFGDAWDRDLETAAYMVSVLSRDWVNYEKDDFLSKMPGTWAGASVAENNGEIVVIRNPSSHMYFEYHFFFPAEAGTRMQFLIARGLEDLRDLWIVGNSGEVVSRLKPASGQTASRAAQKAAKTLEKRFQVKHVAG